MDYKKHFDWVAENDAGPRRRQRGFHAQILRKLKHHIRPGAKVLEWGCGRGEVLKGLEPSRGLGLDISPNMLSQALEKNPGSGLEYREADLQETRIEEEFDAIVLDYLSGYLPDIQKSFENLRPSCHPRTRIYLTSLNYLWKPLFVLAQRIGLILPQPASNWLTTNDLVNLLELSGFEVVTKSTAQLFPFKIPVLDGFFNRFLVKLPFFRHLGASLFIVARPSKPPRIESGIRLFVILPCAATSRANIQAGARAHPRAGRKTELIIRRGQTYDDTWEVIRERRPTRPAGVRYMNATERASDAVYADSPSPRGRAGDQRRTNLDVPARDLPQFYAGDRGPGRVRPTGSRLVYRWESEAMKLLNFIRQQSSVAWRSAVVITRALKDSLCCTKMMPPLLLPPLLSALSRSSADFDSLRISNRSSVRRCWT